MVLTTAFQSFRIPKTVSGAGSGPGGPGKSEVTSVTTADGLGPLSRSHRRRGPADPTYALPAVMVSNS